MHSSPGKPSLNDSQTSGALPARLGRSVTGSLSGSPDDAADDTLRSGFSAVDTPSPDDVEAASLYVARLEHDTEMIRVTVANAVSRLRKDARRESEQEAHASKRFSEILVNFAGKALLLQIASLDPLTVGKNLNTLMAEYERHLTPIARPIFHAFATRILLSLVGAPLNRNIELSTLLGNNIFAEINAALHGLPPTIYVDGVTSENVSQTYHSPSGLIDLYLGSDEDVTSNYFRATQQISETRELLRDPALRHYTSDESKELITLLQKRLCGLLTDESLRDQLEYSIMLLVKRAVSGDQGEVEKRFAGLRTIIEPDLEEQHIVRITDGIQASNTIAALAKAHEQAQQAQKNAHNLGDKGRWEAYYQEPTDADVFVSELDRKHQQLPSRIDILNEHIVRARDEQYRDTRPTFLAGMNLRPSVLTEHVYEATYQAEEASRKAKEQAARVAAIEEAFARETQRVERLQRQFEVESAAISNDLGRAVIDAYALPDCESQFLAIFTACRTALDFADTRRVNGLYNNDQCAAIAGIVQNNLVLGGVTSEALEIINVGLTHQVTTQFRLTLLAHEQENPLPRVFAETETIKHITTQLLPKDKSPVVEAHTSEPTAEEPPHVQVIRTPLPAPLTPVETALPEIPEHLRAALPGAVEVETTPQPSQETERRLAEVRAAVQRELAQGKLRFASPLSRAFTSAARDSEPRIVLPMKPVREGSPTHTPSQSGSRTRAGVLAAGIAASMFTPSVQQTESTDTRPTPTMTESSGSTTASLSSVLRRGEMIAMGEGVNKPYIGPIPQKPKGFLSKAKSFFGGLKSKFIG